MMNPKRVIGCALHYNIYMNFIRNKQNTKHTVYIYKIKAEEKEENTNYLHCDVHLHTCRTCLIGWNQSNMHRVIDKTYFLHSNCSTPVLVDMQRTQKNIENSMKLEYWVQLNKCCYRPTSIYIILQMCSSLLSITLTLQTIIKTKC